MTTPSNTARPKVAESEPGTLSVVAPRPEHKTAWEDLYAGYAEFYRVEQTQAMRETVWGWINDPHEEVQCLLALDERGVPVGLAHYREFARPLRAARGCFLDDLFVAPEARGSGAARSLLEALAALARERDWNVVRWITADDNYRARSLYDEVAERTSWLTYDLLP